MKRVILAGARNGAIVRVDGAWGVVCRSGRTPTRIIVDFWDVGRQYVPKWKPVEMLS